MAALTQAALDTVRGLLEGDAPMAERVAQVRAALPGVSLTRCDASDMDAETPAFETDQFAVYLIDTSEHCVHLTLDPAKATGLVLAQKR
ncbi:hypothetical protein SAMN02949497_0121 [Methylomagnum ishizawai]|uniref:Uncharacterized protein n=1 Tax=Methylomagnum ishizawai TaxID=1760988 RepID=A0A1Y6D4N8_9GAMM|nr:hypothetical protein [Methylomagnum ishizawai]SMF97551.1 hypothetical protein SAMN02949497_0121 [Methylomagnum ishizawai]